ARGIVSRPSHDRRRGGEPRPGQRLFVGYLVTIDRAPEQPEPIRARDANLSAQLARFGEGPPPIAVWEDMCADRGLRLRFFQSFSSVRLSSLRTPGESGWKA